MRVPLFSAKIALAVCLPAVAALVLGLFAVSRLDGLAARSKTLETARLPRADLAVAVERRLLLAAQAIRGYALSGDRDAGGPALRPHGAAEGRRFQGLRLLHQP